MGRCNNRRAREAAETMRKTPSRARFPKQPATQKKKRPGRTGEQKKSAHSAVVQKIVSRIETNTVKPGDIKTKKVRTGVLDGVDISKLDELKLSVETIDMITNLLGDLNVIQVDSSQQRTETAVKTTRKETEISRIEVSEYDDDFVEESTSHFAPARAEPDVEWEAVATTEFDATSNTESDEVLQSEDANGSLAIPDTVRQDPVFVHLTQRMSFTESDAGRASTALMYWKVAEQEGNDEKSRDENLRLSNALDWLCLHLSEKEVERGLKPNPKFSPSDLARNGTGRLATKIKAVPHPSISLAVKLTEDTEWRYNTELEEQAVKFLPLGFHLQESRKACEEVGMESLDISASAIDNSAVLNVLLSDLEKQVWQEEGQTVPEVEITETPDDQEDERQAIEAIYDEQMHVTSKDSVIRYTIKLPFENNEQGPLESASELHIILRKGYPSSLPPFALLFNESLQPMLLRRVNESLARHAIQLIGGPAVFELITFIGDALPDMVSDFLKEQRTLDFEAEQERIRQEVGHNIDDKLDPEDPESAISRRQRRREKHQELSFGASVRKEKEEEARKQRQSERIGRVQTEHKNVRYKMAELAMQQRAKDLEEEELKKVERGAMLNALNSGASPEEARMRAKEARIKHAEGKEDEPEVQTQATAEIDSVNTASESVEQSELSNTGGTPAQPNVSQTTAAFLDRLRTMYASAASSSVSVTGAKACMIGESQSKKADVRLPRPVAFPVGDIAHAVDIIDGQAAQPWLIAEEARVPAVKEGSKALPIHEVERKRDDSSKILLSEARTKHKSRPFKTMLSSRKKLPAFQSKDEIIHVISTNQVTVVSGSTGSGKSTQVPQLVLDDMIENSVGSSANIIITQPRRISAIGVAERVAAERAERIGETCGYSIKLEKKWSAKTRLLFCTTGILLRRLQVDPDLASVSHVFVDEVHERDLNTDFLLIILKELLSRRHSLKLVLMSATLNAKIFARFFGGCAIVSIPGRTFPVKEYRLEDVLSMTQYEVQEGSDYAWKGKGSTSRPSKSALRKMYHSRYKSSVIHSLSIVDEAVINYELLAKLLEFICNNNGQGAILIFLPGMMEIGKAIDEMRKLELFQSDKVLIYPLHSSLSTTDQTAVFDVPPAGVRKIVCSTNISETSITIEDVVYVVDAGRVKENRRDEVKETPALVECWVSRASAKQRRGRAGRVQPGIAYHLFSSHTHDSEMQEYQLPEMLRVGLEDLVLQILILDLGEPSEFLSRSLDPPSALALRNSLKLLEGLGAIECRWNNDSIVRNTYISESGDIIPQSCATIEVETELTALGYNLASLPVEPRVGKMIIYGAMFGCIDPALTIAASMSSKSVFASSFEDRSEADNCRGTFSPEGSDHLATLRAFNEWRKLRAQGDKNASTFTRKNYLSRLTLFQMEDLRKQFSNLLVCIGFLPKKFRVGGKGRAAAASTPLKGPNSNAENIAMLKAVLCAGLYPNIIVAPRPLVDGSTNQEAAEYSFNSLKGEVHLHPCTLSFHKKKLESRYACYHEIVKTSKTYVRDMTTASPFALLLFGGKLVVHHTKGVVTVDDWLKFRLSASSATLIKHLRSQMERALLEKIVNPEIDLADIPSAQPLIQAVNTLLDTEKVVPVARNDGADIVRPYELPGGRGRGRGGRRGGGRQGRGGRDGGRGRGK